MTEEERLQQVSLFTAGLAGRKAALHAYINGRATSFLDLDKLADLVGQAIIAREKLTVARAEYRKAFPIKEVPPPVDTRPVDYNYGPDKYGRLGH